MAAKLNSTELQRNAYNPAEFFNIPSNQIVAIGAQVVVRQNSRTKSARSNVCFALCLAI